MKLSTNIKNNLTIKAFETVVRKVIMPNYLIISNYLITSIAKNTNTNNGTQYK